MITVLRNTGTRLTQTFEIDGTPTAADGSVTVTITKADGSNLTSGTAALDTANSRYTFDLPAQSLLNLLTVAWTGTFSGQQVTLTDQVEIAGGVYCSTADFRAVDGLASTDVGVLAKWRRSFEGIAERYCGVAFVPRYARQHVPGNGLTSILLPVLPTGVYPALRRNPNGTPAIYTLSSTNTAGTVTAFTLTNWTVTDFGQITTDGDVLTRTVYGERNLIFEYEHGLDEPPDYIAQGCLDYVAAKVLQSSSRNARDLLSTTDPSGFTQRWSTPDPDAGRPTGLLDVDANLNLYGRAAPVTA